MNWNEIINHPSTIKIENGYSVIYLDDYDCIRTVTVKCEQDIKEIESDSKFNMWGWEF